ncbi:DUF5318 domain-containing protein [soil metagenome]
MRRTDRRGVVDYALRRRAALADLSAGRASVHDLCDAHPYLRRAARFHGQPTDIECPVCRKEQLTDVHYVYGDTLKTTAGQAKTAAELAEMAAAYDEFSVYVVEVCPSCGWNHLSSSYVLGRPAAQKRSAGRRAATE